MSIEKAVTIHDQGRVRVTADRYSVVVEELPRKPCKRRLRRCEINSWYAQHVLHLDAFITGNLFLDARIGPESDYDQITWELRSALGEAVRRIACEYGEPSKMLTAVQTYAAPTIEETEVYHAKVTPADAKPFTLRGSGFSVEISWEGFTAYSPGSTMHYAPDGDPHYSRIVHTSPSAARKLYKLGAKQPSVLQDVSWSDFHAFLEEKKIAHRYEFSQWS